MTAMRERIKALETHVGDDAESGLRGDVALLNKKFDRIIERFTSSEKRMAALVGGGIAVVWMIEHFHVLSQ